ncbi:hypothetical protein Fcan01_10574 [Folsomia candida]|uniref:Uncharacterized protein n=1 Tax=Folsomia candida TaxID=158441 RepID=A0A226E9S3_FOLCA|nr:hypothetical protein Fcan01_10574 [Folsomia candida]
MKHQNRWSDFTRYDAAVRIGQDIFPSELSGINPKYLQQPPSILTHINETIVSMHEKVSFGLKEILATYQSDITYRSVYSKHNMCNVVQIFSYWLPSDDVALQIFIAILQVLDSSVNPHFIFFEDTNLGKNSILKFPTVSHIATNAVFGVFNSDTGETSLIRWVKGDHGSSNDLVGPRISEFPSTQELIMSWKQLNSDLAETKVFMMYMYTWHKEEYCSFYTPRDRVARIHRFFDNDCVKSSFLYRKNVSLTPKPEFAPDSVSFISSETMTFSEIIKFLVGSRKSFSFDWINYGVRMETYMFSVFLEAKEIVARANLGAILLPFDIGIWILILAIGSSLALLLFHVSGKRTRSLLWLLGNFLDQSDLLWSKIKFPRIWNICFPAISGWTMISLFLGFAYKGALFSCMTSTPRPDVPKYLNDLLQSEIPLITTTYFTSIASKVPMSPLEILCRDLLEMLDPAEGLHTIAVALLSRTIFVPSFHKGVEIAENISRSVQVETCADPHDSNCSSCEGSTEVGNKFAVISVKEDIAAFSNYLNFFGAKLIQVENDSPNPVTYKVPWIAYSNGVYDILSRHLGALVESGIHSWWRRNSHVAGQVRLLVQNKFKSTENDELGSIPGLVQQLWVSGRVGNMNMFGSKVGQGGIEIGMFLAPFIILSVALGFAWVVFLSEYAIHKKL